MTSQPDQQTNTIQILPNFSQRKTNWSVNRMQHEKKFSSKILQK